MTYIFTPPTGNVEDLPHYIAGELAKIADSVNGSSKYTQEHFEDKDSFVNKQGKGEGVSVWDSTAKKPVWAQGNDSEAVWIFGDGTVAYSPK